MPGTEEHELADQGSVSDLLADLLEGRTVAQAVGGEAAALAMLARRCERLAVPGPAPASEVHIRTRVLAMLEGNRAGRPLLGGWLGGAAVRPLRERLAAGALLFAIAGGSASVATGVSPVEFASGVGEFARSVVVNLTPGDGTGENAAPTPDASPSQTAPAAGQSTPDATSTPSPTLTPSSTPAGSGSTITPAGSSTPAPTQTSVASPTTQPALTATPTQPANAVTQSPTQSSTPQTATPPGSSATPDQPDDSDNRTRTPEPGDDNGGGSSGSGSSGSGSSGSGSSGSGSDD